MLYLVRHGETVWNALGRYQGAKDSPLTDKGCAQAHSVGRLLRRSVAAERLDAYVSPLGRARQTACLIGDEMPLNVTIENRLAEVSLGSWDGLTEFEIEAEWPGALAGATVLDWYFRSPDGETLDAVVERVRVWLETATRPAVAISHGLVGRIVRGVYLGLGKAEMLALAVPQDGVFRLTDGGVEYLQA